MITKIKSSICRFFNRLNRVKAHKKPNPIFLSSLRDFNEGDHISTTYSGNRRYRF